MKLDEKPIWVCWKLSRSKLRFRWVLFFSAAFLSLGSRAHAQLLPARIGIQQIALSFAPIQLADAAGIFKKHGIAPEMIMLSAPASTPALLNGDIDLNTTAFTEILKLAGQGELAAIQSVTNLSIDLNMSKSFLEKAGLSSVSSVHERVAKLKGSVLGVSSLTGPPDLFTRWLLRNYGSLVPEKDVTIRNIGNLPALVAAVKTGAIDGFMLSVPAGPLLEQQGIGKIYVSHSEIPEWKGLPFGVVQVTRAALKKEPETFRRTVAAIAEAQDILIQDADKAAEILVKSRYYSKVDLQIMKRSLSLVRDAFTERGLMTADGWARALKVARDMSMFKVPSTIQEGVDWTNEFIPK